MLLEVVVSVVAFDIGLQQACKLTFLKNDHIELDLTFSFRNPNSKKRECFSFLKFVIAIGKAEIDERSIRVSDAILVRTRDDPGRTRDFRERLEVGCDASGSFGTDPLEPALSTSIRHASSPADNRSCTAG